MKRVVRTIAESDAKIDDIYAMANLYPKRTGLPVILWVDNLGSARKLKHNIPRLKVQNVPGDKAVDDAFEVSISKTPQILSGECRLNRKQKHEIFNYIEQHYNDFIDHWNQEIDEDELKERLYK